MDDDPMFVIMLTIVVTIILLPIMFELEYELCSRCVDSLVKQLKSDRAKVYDKILGRC